MQLGQLFSAKEIIAFIQGGNARFTIVSRKSGARFTYRVQAAENSRDLFFVSLLRGSDNESDYQYMGTIRNRRFAHGVKSRISADAASVQAFAFFHKHLAAGRLHEMVEFWHEGRCARCARPLTDPESIAVGFGPECFKKVPLTIGTL